MFQLETTNTTLEHKESPWGLAQEADAWVSEDKLWNRVNAALTGKPSYAPWIKRQTDIKFLRKESRPDMI